jgi:ubiquinone/menaquinone biosynthesis C-methylase UbiE
MEIFHTQTVQVKKHFNSIAGDYDSWRKKNKYYSQQVKDLYIKNVPADQSVLEIGCGTGTVISEIAPLKGVGIDISEKMIGVALKNYPHISFLVSDAMAIALKQKFTYVIAPDFIDHAPDIWTFCREVESVTAPGGFLILNTINPIWRFLLDVFEWLKLKMPEGPHTFYNLNDITEMLKLFSFKVKKQEYFLFIPKDIILVSRIINRLIPRIPFLRTFCLCQYIIAEKDAVVAPQQNHLSASIIIPCHNEEMNIEQCYFRIPSIGSSLEVIFIDDGSTDKTKDNIEALMAHDKRIKLISYPRCRGKGYAIKRGFEAATKDVLMILDADMSVMPEELPQFFSVINEGKAGFVNGTRMVYPVKQSMNVLHVLGNKIFSYLFSWILGQRITDTLCGTKVFLRKDYERFRLFAKNDPWGDFDLLISAAKTGIKIVELPIRYQKRSFGYSKMRPFKHGFILLSRVVWGFKELKLDR